MTTPDWIALVAVLQTLAMMGAGFYVWTAGRRNIDLDNRFRVFKAELENEWKDRERQERHAMRNDVQTFMAKLQGEVESELTQMRQRIDSIIVWRSKP